MVIDKIDPRQRAWVEVFPEAIKKNTLVVKKLLSKDCALMAVVKADGYGHGSTTVAQAALSGGASHLGVATLQEALDLRQSGIACPILILGSLFTEEDFKTCLNWDLMPTLSDFKEAVLCQKIASSQKKKLFVHIKLDTGMTRLGCDLKVAQDLIDFVDDLDNLCLNGIYSHLALADTELYSTGTTFTSMQKERFRKILLNLQSRKQPFFRHLANSAGTLRDQELHFDMVRVGLAIYGYNPFNNAQVNYSLTPALAVRAKVTLIRTVPSDTGVSYGHSYVTKRATRLAVVGIGYADGVNRSLSGKISVLIQGRFYPQVGSITMDQLLVDITDQSDIQVGSVVTLLGQDGNEVISAFEWSNAIGSIPWEVLCGFKYRLPRVVI